MRVYRIPFSTNVERVSLALAHKRLAVQWVEVDPANRNAVVRASGQELVPVLEHEGHVIADSPLILEYLEKRFPEPPLLPREPASRAEVRVFCNWFNQVWKKAPNAIVAEEQRAEPDVARIETLGAQIARTVPLFEDFLTGRDYLFGALTLADVTAFPFLKYAVLWVAGDPDRFHAVLRDRLRLDGGFPRFEAWIHRVDALPRA